MQPIAFEALVPNTVVTNPFRTARLLYNCSYFICLLDEASLHISRLPLPTFPRFFHLRNQNKEQFRHMTCLTKWKAHSCTETILLFRDITITAFLGPETFNFSKLRFQTVNLPPLTSIFYLFKGSAVLPDLHSLGFKPSVSRISKMTLFYCLNGQQTELFTIRETILQIKQRSSEKRGKLQPKIKSCEWNQIPSGCRSTILHPLTEIKGRKFCSNSQQANKFVDCSNSYLQIKPRNSELEGMLQLDIKFR